MAAGPGSGRFIAGFVGYCQSVAIQRKGGQRRCAREDTFFTSLGLSRPKIGYRAREGRNLFFMSYLSRAVRAFFIILIYFRRTARIRSPAAATLCWVGGILMRVAIYSRVSTKDKGQEISNQVNQLRDFCLREGFAIVQE